MPAKEEKEKRLEEILKEMKGVVVAFSGGVDSTYLLAKAREVIQNNVIAVTAISPLHPLREIEEAKERASQLKVEHVLLESKELENAEFRSNPPHRCYLCRKMLYSHFRELARQKDISHILNGSNKDDGEKARPGMRAALEYDVRSPLQEAGLLKREIRQLAREAGLPNWNKPALPCLATRFQYGEQLTLTKLEQVERSEDFLRSIGFEKLRVRYHGEIARLELDSSMMEEIMSRRKKIAIVLQKLGFTYVTLDLCSAMEEKE
ncbi:MAG: ATP-dependent sacrificial sulfur transferase LarE [Dethiobacter sp.]|jgi:uncharacterized protein|nr:MAG: ATP-dependent sacrificial sulfur transferase LarE [Dethiobacter sp.]